MTDHLAARRRTDAPGVALARGAFDCGFSLWLWLCLRVHTGCDATSDLGRAVHSDAGFVAALASRHSPALPILFHFIIHGSLSDASFRARPRSPRCWLQPAAEPLLLALLVLDAVVLGTELLQLFTRAGIN